MEIIVDNLDLNTVAMGSWKKSSGSDPWDGNSVYGEDGGAFRWFPELPVAGDYEVYAWWTYHSNYSRFYAV